MENENEKELENQDFMHAHNDTVEKVKNNMPEEELLLKANQWELSHGGLSGRTASQFITHLLGTEQIQEESYGN